MLSSDVYISYQTHMSFYGNTKPILRGIVFTCDNSKLTCDSILQANGFVTFFVQRTQHIFLSLNHILLISQTKCRCFTLSCGHDLTLNIVLWSKTTSKFRTIYLICDYSIPMATPPKKSALEYILNQDAEQTQNNEQGKSRRRPRSGGSASSSASSPSNLVRTTARAELESLQNQSTDPSIPSSRIPETPAGTSQSHARIQGERNFTCPTCGKKFNERGNLNKHISSVHLKQKSKICPEPNCDKSFSFRDGLSRHIAQVHQNQRPHSCQKCGRCFKQASHLHKHMRSIHKDMNQ